MKTQKNKSLSRVVLISSIVLFISINAFAQPYCKSKERLEKIKVQKIAFITDELDLTTDEAQKFWPVYNEYQEKVTLLRKENGHRYGQIKSDSISDKEAEKIVDNHLIHAQKMLDLRKEYYLKLKGVLPSKKIMKLNESEIYFKRYLLKQIRGHKKGNFNVEPK